MNATNRISLALMMFAVVFATPGAIAHCDTLSGPVVSEARRALAKGDVTPVLKWIAEEHEAEIRRAFAQTLVVRRQSPAAAELADRFFFETLVRLHRAGEGEAYTGLKPAGVIDPGAEAADAAIAANDASRISTDLRRQIDDELKVRLERVVEAKQHANDSVAAGRKYVAAYVQFLHFTEQLFATVGSAHAQTHDASPKAASHGDSHSSPRHQR